ncbi:MAG: four helix bundle protein [Ferruginibacter sp.]
MNEEKVKTYNIRHRAYYFSKAVIEFISSSKYERIYYSIFDQLLRNTTSVGANLVEGISGSSKKDFVNFYRIALKSANETKYWLCLIRDTLNADKRRLEELLKEAGEISKIIASIIIAIK